MTVEGRRTTPTIEVFGPLEPIEVRWEPTPTSSEFLSNFSKDFAKSLLCYAAVKIIEATYNSSSYEAVSAAAFFRSPIAEAIIVAFGYASISGALSLAPIPNIATWRSRND